MVTNLEAMSDQEIMKIPGTGELSHLSAKQRRAVIIASVQSRVNGIKIATTTSCYIIL